MGESFPVWRILSLDKHNTGISQIANLKHKGFRVGRAAEVLTKKISSEAIDGVARLVRVTGPDLGLHLHEPLQAFYDNFERFGLKICRPTIAQALREAYHDQPMNEILWVISPRMSQSKTETGVLCVGHNECGKWLYFGCGNGCSWGKWRFENLSPKTQNCIVPRWLCECPWSLAPITAIFEI